ncbi:response regulator [Sulfobacillus sp. hq2]|uniref:response regulator n=1 Tax=Sulfobacillus TaxID=28033 RepID=UPI001304BFED|nr:response regulator [Sulfobacillus sp. hq2]
MHIWLIDDNQALLDLLVSCLDEVNVCPRAFATAQDVIYLSENLAMAPDIIVMDWTLPDLPATHLLDYLVRMYPTARLVVMSGDFSIESRLPYGARFLAKPFRLATFREIVMEIAAAVTEAFPSD